MPQRTQYAPRGKVAAFAGFHVGFLVREGKAPWGIPLRITAAEAPGKIYRFRSIRIKEPSGSGKKGEPEA